MGLYKRRTELILQKLSSILQSVFLKFTSIVFIGNLSSQVIILISSILFAHYFKIENLGMYAIFTSICMVGAIFVTGRYEMAIMLPKSKTKSTEVLILTLSIALIVSGVLASLGCIFYILNTYFAWLTFDFSFFLIPFSIFFVAMIQSLAIWNNKFERFTITTLAKIVQAISMLILSLLLGKTMEWTAASLIYALVLSQFIHVMVLGFYLSKVDTKLLHPKKERMKELATEYNRYPKISLFSDFLNIFSREMPNYIIPAFWGTRVEGFYSYANKVAAMPQNLISASVGDVYFKSASDLFQNNKEKLIKHTIQIIIGLLVLAILLYIPAITLSKWAFTTFFGENYYVAAQYFDWIAIGSIFLFIQTPISFLSDILNKLKDAMYFKIVSFVIKAGVLLGCAWTKVPALEMIAYFSISNAILSLFWVGYLYFLVKKTTMNE